MRLKAGRRLRLEGRCWGQLGRVKVEGKKLVISNPASNLKPPEAGREVEIKVEDVRERWEYDIDLIKNRLKSVKEILG